MITRAFSEIVEGTLDHQPASESDLVARAVAGDETALSDLLYRFGPMVRGHIVPLIGSVWQSILEADDIMQVTYMEAFLRVGQFQPRGEGAFLAWLKSIAKNNLRDAVRALEQLKRPQPSRRVTAPAGTDTTFALLEQIGCTTSTPSRTAASADICQAVERALHQLPDDYAEVIRLYDLAGKSSAAVAEELGRSEGAVFMLRARAHDRLRETIGSDTQFFTRA